MTDQLKSIVFLTGTRADFGKIKALIEVLQSTKNIVPHIFVTGMHLDPKYGLTADEIQKCGYRNVHLYSNSSDHETMDLVLARTIEGFSQYVQELHPDLIVIHGDRVEALAGAIVGALNNILTAHIEGGELSGTVDELIRHSVSKMSHVHFVSNESAKNRLLQLGENSSSIFVIGSPDVDVMLSPSLPSFQEIQRYYEIPFHDYGVAAFHPVTTELDDVPRQAREFVDALIESEWNYVIIFPNNDHGSEAIFREFHRLENNSRFRIFPSMRFEYFLVLLKHAKFIVGNSSAGIREAPYYGVPTVNIGSRQHNRTINEDILNCKAEKEQIVAAITQALHLKRVPARGNHFGEGKSASLFLEALETNRVWSIPTQKIFNDLTW